MTLIDSSTYASQLGSKMRPWRCGSCRHVIADVDLTRPTELKMVCQRCSGGTRTYNALVIIRAST
jgi:hypothetical protein